MYLTLPGSKIKKLKQTKFQKSAVKKFTTHLTTKNYRI